MRNIWVKPHVLYRWPERVGTPVSEKYIEQMFKNNRYNVLEPARRGRLIVHIKDYVFVVTRTNSTLIIHTVYGRYADYSLKRPHAVDDLDQVERDRWERHQYINKVRFAK